MGRFLKSVETGIAVILSASVVASCRQVPPVQVSESPSPTISPSPVKVDTKGAAKLRQLGLRSRRQGRYAEAIGFLWKKQLTSTQITFLGKSYWAGHST